MTEIIRSIEEAGPFYRVLYCDLWGCLHDGTRALPEAVGALQRFRAGGGAVVLLTNSPRPSREVARQVAALGAPRDCFDLVVSSGDAAQAALISGSFGRRVHHIGPQRDLAFFHHDGGRAIDVARVPLEEAESIVCTGLFDDRTETPDDYRATLLWAKNEGLPMLCANPDIVVDVGETRIYCAGALARAYGEIGGRVFLFGKPHPPIYALTRDRLEAECGIAPAADDILVVGDGIATDILGAMGEGFDAVFISGGLAAAETGTGGAGNGAAGPDPDLLAKYLAAAKLAPRFAMAYLR